MKKNLIVISFLFLLLWGFTIYSKASVISAHNAVLLEGSKNEIVFEKNSDERVPMASTTKIMTAIVALENCKLDKVVCINQKAVGVEGSSIYLQAGEKLTMEQLLYALMLESANDVAAAIAIEVGGSLENFVDMMNRKALDLGLRNTHFTNPHGLDNEDHYTTAKELAFITSYSMNNPVFAEIVSTKKKIIPLNGSDGSRVLINHNRLLNSLEGVVGVKTGFTKKSGRCLVSCAEVDGVRMICVTLNDPNDWKDHTDMLTFGLSQYKCLHLAEIGSYTLSLNICNGQKDRIYCSNFEPLSLIVSSDNTDITSSVETNRLLFAPIKQNSKVGRIVFYNREKEIGHIDLYAIETVKQIKNKKSFWNRVFG